jgi:hypothetical protein
MGMRCLKVGSVPAKADVDEQAEYKQKSWNPDLSKPKRVNEPWFLSMQPTV